MAPKLRVLVSTDSAYPPSHPCNVNSTTPTRIKNANFEGEINVYVKGFEGEHKSGDGEEYFSVRTGMTYGIVVRGRFLDDVSADDIVFGNVFEKPIRDHLPWGTSIAVKFMYFVDPTMEHDVYCDRPWALSPTMATMNYLSIADTKSTEDGDKHTPGGTGTTIEENVEIEGSGIPKGDVKARRRFFGDKEKRKGVSLKGKEVGMEFANGLLDFNTLSAHLPPPFTLSIPLLKYWDGQPVTYVCQRRGTPGKKEDVYFSVAFEIVDEDARRALEQRGGKAVERTHDGHESAEGGGVKEQGQGKEEEVSDDVD